MKGDIKITVSHVIIADKEKHGKNEVNRKIEEKSNASKTFSNILNRISHKFIGKLTISKVALESAREVGRIFTSEYASWSGDTNIGEYLGAAKNLMGYARNVYNPIRIMKDLYKYGQEISKINAEAERLATRSGNNSLTNGNRGTRD